MKHYLFYLRWETAQALQRQHSADVYPELSYSASGQFKPVQVGDVLWIVTIAPHFGELSLVGRLLVGWKGPLAEARQRLGTDFPINAEKPWHVIAAEDCAEPMDEINLGNVAAALRFKSRQDRLRVVAGHADAQQLQRLRELTDASVELLTALWYGETRIPQDSLEYLEVIEDEIAYTEGQAVFRTRKARQRSQALVKQAKESFKQAQGRLYCQACGFDFTAVYGQEYIEAHHLTPMAVSDEARESTPGDLVLLCANCHRMIHSRTPPLSLAELQRLIRRDARHS